MGLVDDLINPQWKGVKVEQEPAVMYDAAAGDVCIGEEEMASGVFSRVFADPRHHVSPAAVVWVAVVHYLDLAEVYGLDSYIDIAGGEIEEPHAGLEPAHIGYG